MKTQRTRKEHMKDVSQILVNIYADKCYTLKGSKLAAQPWIEYLTKENLKPNFSNQNKGA